MSLPNVSYCEKENEVHYNLYVEPSQPNDEIWYTTTDGNIISNLYESGDGSVGACYGKNGDTLLIESNIYENGKGIMKFNDEINSIKSAFQSCASLVSATIPNSVTTIGENAFQECSSLTGITIPDSVIEIGYMAFYNCSKLSSITIPDSVTSIGNQAFYYCNELSSITVLPTTPPTIGAASFDFIASDAKIYVPSGSVDAYKSATNWSTYADKIQAIS